MQEQPHAGSAAGRAIGIALLDRLPQGREAKISINRAGHNAETTVYRVRRGLYSWYRIVGSREAGKVAKVPTSVYRSIDR